ncbi:Cardiolipin synthase N-terminal [Candidatus Nanopelagicaceae bacterium]
MIKLEAFLLLASLALTLYTFIDCAMRDETQIQKLPKWGWLLVILFISTFGAIAYLVIGRSRGPKGPRGPKRRVLPPDDDPDFLRKL